MPHKDEFHCIVCGKAIPMTFLKIVLPPNEHLGAGKSICALCDFYIERHRKEEGYKEPEGHICNGPTSKKISFAKETTPGKLPDNFEVCQECNNIFPKKELHPMRSGRWLCDNCYPKKVLTDSIDTTQECQNNPVTDTLCTDSRTLEDCQNRPNYIRPQPRFEKPECDCGNPKPHVSNGIQCWKHI